MTWMIYSKINLILNYWCNHLTIIKKYDFEAIVSKQFEVGMQYSKTHTIINNVTLSRKCFFFLFFPI